MHNCATHLSRRPALVVRSCSQTSTRIWEPHGRTQSMRHLHLRYCYYERLTTSAVFFLLFYRHSFLPCACRHSQRRRHHRYLTTVLGMTAGDRPIGLGRKTTLGSVYGSCAARQLGNAVGSGKSPLALPRLPLPRRLTKTASASRIYPVAPASGDPSPPTTRTARRWSSP